MIILKKINVLILSLSFIFSFFNTSFAFSETYFPTQKDFYIQSIIINDKKALVKMAQSSVSFSIKIMKNSDTYRAYGVTPKGMKIGLKYNNILLRLVAIDKAEKNYMVADFISKIAPSKKINFPNNYKSPIAPDEIYLSSTQFIQSYPFWLSENVARGFDLLSSKEKGIIQLFPAIHLELADKLCHSDDVTVGIFELLSEQQKINCDDLSILNKQDFLKKLQSLANHERILLTKVLECSQGNRQPTLCQKINQELAEKTLQSITIQSILKKIQQ